jgi:lipopolysaccharide transport system permease protein
LLCPLAHASVEPADFVEELNLKEESAPPVTPPAPLGDPGSVVIQASSGITLRLREVWDYRELLYFLFWRDLKVRYKQTVLGGVWAILQPVATMAVFTIVLGRLAKISSDGIPYSLFVFSGLLPWQLFAFSLTASSGSLVSNTHLITKVYFPRLVIPISSVLVGLVDFLIAAVVLALLMAYHHVAPTPGLLLLPLLVAFAVAVALAVGIFLSALNVRYRDVKHMLPFLVQIWMFATPIVYPSSLVPEKWRPLFGLNPMAGVVDGFRWALFGTSIGGGRLILVSVVSVAMFLFVGIAYFRRMERNFADLV